jgi:hypothetical protein
MRLLLSSPPSPFHPLYLAPISLPFHFKRYFASLEPNWNKYKIVFITVVSAKEVTHLCMPPSALIFASKGRYAAKASFPHHQANFILWEHGRTQTDARKRNQPISLLKVLFPSGIFLVLQNVIFF